MQYSDENLGVSGDAELNRTRTLIMQGESELASIQQKNRQLRKEMEDARTRSDELFKEKADLMRMMREETVASHLLDKRCFLTENKEDKIELTNTKLFETMQSLEAERNAQRQHSTGYTEMTQDNEQFTAQLEKLKADLETEQKKRQQLESQLAHNKESESRFLADFEEQQNRFKEEERELKVSIEKQALSLKSTREQKAQLETEVATLSLEIDTLKGSLSLKDLDTGLTTRMAHATHLQKIQEMDKGARLQVHYQTASNQNRVLKSELAYLEKLGKAVYT